MKIEELRQEIDEIIRIFRSAKYYELDFIYINSIKLSQPIVYSTFYYFIERIYHSSCVVLILELSKLFEKDEKFSLLKLKNKIIDNYEKSELNNYLQKKDIEIIFNPINSEAIELILKKLKDTRDKYYAHFDRTRPNFSEIQIDSSETGLLISIVEEILKTIELKFFNVSVDYNLTINELGHNIFERLDEWEKYRETYGYINTNLE